MKEFQNQSISLLYFYPDFDKSH